MSAENPTTSLAHDGPSAAASAERNQPAVSHHGATQEHGELSWIDGGGVTSPRGFLAAGMHCGIKRAKPDLALLATAAAVPAAGMFTTNRVQAAPVLYCKEVLTRGSTEASASHPGVRAVVVNSGNANACTGGQGMADTREMAELTAAALGAQAHEVLVCSTGVIGQRLPIAALRQGIPEIAARLGASADAGRDAAMAILTTDTTLKSCACRVQLRGGVVTVGGMAKGSGMIAPDLELALPHATTLAFLTTDARLAGGAVAALLEPAMLGSFNSITVDSDTSTNDTVLLLASGGAEVEVQGDEDLRRLQCAITAVARRLALDVVRDGEGATRLLEIRVAGASGAPQARRVARSVADSPLVKTAFHAGEPNWGRLLMAVGKGDREVVAERIGISVGGLQIVAGGLGTAHDAADLSRRMTADEVLIEIELGQGEHSTTIWTCDLSAEYVRINASYMS